MKSYRIFLISVFLSLLIFSKAFSQNWDSLMVGGMMAPDSALKVNLPYSATNFSDLTGTVIVLEPDQYMNVDYNTSVIGGINGRIPGLQWFNNIWGLGDALVMVDGVPRDINSVTMNEIDQITIMKGANAIALYGSQASNGVILITTKRGVVGERTINVRVNNGIQTPIQYPNYLGSAEYMELFNEARVNDGLLPVYDQQTIDNHASGNNFRYPSIDFFSDEYLRSLTNNTEVFGEFFGGDEKAQFYSNVGLTRGTSLLNIGEGQNENFSRVNFRGNVDVNLSELITSSIDMSIVLNNERLGFGNYWGNAATIQPFRFSPLIPTSLVSPAADGAQSTIENSQNLINGQFLIGGAQDFLTTPFGDLYATGYFQNISRSFQATNRININLDQYVKGLTFNSQLNVDFNNGYTQSIQNQYAIHIPVWSPTADSIIDLTTFNEDRSSAEQFLGNSFQTRNLGATLQFNYDNTFNGVHHVHTTLLGTVTSITTSGIIQPFLNTNLGFRAAYNYKNKYVANFSSALVNSTRLPEGNRSAFSPTVGLGWVISEESFLAGADKIDYLKLNASAGIINTDANIQDYYLYDDVYFRGAFFGWNAGEFNNQTYESLQGANPNLGFAKRREISLGFESSLFNKNLWLDGNFFITQITDIPVQRFSIYPSYFRPFVPYTNYNANQWQGFDLSANTIRNFGELSVNIGANFTYVTSQATQRDELFIDEYQNRQGRPIDAIFGLQSEGFFTSDGDVTSSAEHTFEQVQPGDIKYVDQNNDGQIDERDEVMIGRFTSPANFGLNITTIYKGFSLFVQATGNFGGDAIRNNNYFWVDGNDKYSEVVRDRWTPETAETASFPRLSSIQNNNNFRTSDYWLYSTNRVTLSKIQLNYNLPGRLTQNIGINNIDLFVNGANLFMFSKNRDIMTLNVGSAPQMRFYTLGIVANF